MKFIIIKSTVGDRDAYHRTMSDHHRYLAELRQRKKLILSGIYEDRSGAMLLIEASGFEEAITIARRDPLVQAGVDRYQLKVWSPTVTPDLESVALDPPIKPVDTSPLLAPPPEEDNFQVVEGSEHPLHDRLLVHCLAPDTIAVNDPIRLGYLRVARERGLRKLLLLHEETVAGQLETVPPEVSGFPVSGEGLLFVHCIWVQEAYTGLEGGRRLLAAAAATEGVRSLATVAYNEVLPWMPMSFFEAQGFTCIDQLETGRFYENVPIVAYLMWRPLADDAPPPTWDREKFLDGVDFCPAYPWMFGKRLYWGDRYDHHAVLVREGLRRPEVLRQLPILASQRNANWTIVKVGIPRADLSRAVELIRATLIDEPTYFAHVYDAETADEVTVVFPDRVFSATSDRESWNEAVQYGIDKGIPREELVFSPLTEEE